MVTTTAYIRVSTDKQTLENQRDEITRFAKKNEITVDRWVEEIASGKAQGVVLDRKCQAPNIQGLAHLS